MRRIAFNVRNEWVTVNEWLENQERRRRPPKGRRIVEILRDDASQGASGESVPVPAVGDRWFQ